MSDAAEGRRLVLLRRLGTTPYEQAREAQRRIAGRLAEHSEQPGELLLCSHPDVVTLGRTTKDEHLTLSEDEIRARGVSVVRTDRGGSVTFHGPGQIVAYPILHLAQFGKDLALHLRRLEDVVLRTLRGYGLEGRRAPGMTGVWIAFPEGPRKICALGIGVRRWVTYHGLALNVDCDLSRFGLFIPCGLKGFRVTSMRECLKDSCPSMPDVEAKLIAAFGEVFGARIEESSA